MKNIYFIVIAVITIIYMLYSIRKNKLSANNSFIWIIFCIALLLLSIFPTSLDWLAKFVGIEYPPALFLTIAVVILFIQNFIDSKRIEELQKKLVNVSQELSVTKHEVEKLKTKNKK